MYTLKDISEFKRYGIAYDEFIDLMSMVTDDTYYKIEKSFNIVISELKNNDDIIDDIVDTFIDDIVDDIKNNLLKGYLNSHKSDFIDTFIDEYYYESDEWGYTVSDDDIDKITAIALSQYKPIDINNILFDEWGYELL